MRQPDEHPLAPAAHARLAAALDRHPGQEVGGGVRVDVQLGATARSPAGARGMSCSSWNPKRAGHVHDPVVGRAELVERDPLVGRRRAARSPTCTDTMTTRSCRTWLNSTFARSASGAVSFVGCGKTAVPGTRGMSLASQLVDELGQRPLHGRPAAR